MQMNYPDPTGSKGFILVGSIFETQSKLEFFCSHLPQAPVFDKYFELDVGLGLRVELYFIL